MLAESNKGKGSFKNDKALFIYTVKDFYNLIETHVQVKRFSQLERIDELPKVYHDLLRQRLEESKKLSRKSYSLC